MADISTGRQRGIVPFVDETTGRLPDQYLPQGVIDLQGDLEQAVSDASQSATAASQSASQAQSNATAANSSAQAAAASAESAQTATESAASSKDAAAQSASEASASAQAAEASKTNAASSASAAETSKTNAAASATAAQQAVEGFGLEVGTTTTGEPGTDAAVSIAKQGTKYVADFTIPRGEKGDPGIQGPKGDPGDLTTVAHDATLTGDGTSSAPLGAAVGSTLNQGITTESRDLDFNTYTSSGIYGITSDGGVQNGPSEMKNKLIRAALLVSQCGYNKWYGSILQVLFIRNTSAQDLGIYMRGLRSGTWDEWLRIASMSDVRNASELTSRIAALEAESNELAVMRTRLQALEARIKSLETN